ncbi:MAG: hypothetical protein AAGU27_21870 [Dehalobacterium sp.]
MQSIIEIGILIVLLLITWNLKAGFQILEKQLQLLNEIIKENK